MLFFSFAINFHPILLMCQSLLQVSTRLSVVLFRLYSFTSRFYSFTSRLYLFTSCLHSFLLVNQSFHLLVLTKVLQCKEQSGTHPIFWSCMCYLHFHLNLTWVYFSDNWNQNFVFHSKVRTLFLDKVAFSFNFWKISSLYLKFCMISPSKNAWQRYKFKNLSYCKKFQYCKTFQSKVKRNCSLES